MALATVRKIHNGYVYNFVRIWMPIILHKQLDNLGFKFKKHKFVKGGLYPLNITLMDLCFLTLSKKF